jgi:hypothetical protein
MAGLRAREIFRDGVLVLIALESVELLQQKTRSACQMYGRVEPVAVVVCGRGEPFALDMQSAPLALERLKEQVPELDGMLEALVAG